MHLVGTVRKNRKGLPKEVIDAKLKRGEYKAAESNDGITCLKWKDKRDVGQSDNEVAGPSAASPVAGPSQPTIAVSPLRVPCPLVPGPPEAPPPHIPQAWELQKKALEAMWEGRGPSRVVLEEEDEEGAATPPPSMDQPIVFTPSTGVIEMEDVDEALVVDATIELVGFSPNTSFSAERSTLQNFSPGPSTSRPEPSIFEADLDGEILQWERSVVLNPGSYVEDEDAVDEELPRRRHAGEFVVEELSSELREVLGSIDTQDDRALRESSREDLLHFDWSHDPQRCLHFVDNALCSRGKPSKLTKIQPILDHLVSKFRSLYLPEQDIAIDKSLMLWKGRLSFSQLIATKAAQLGVKSYELCESKTGYLWNIIIYTGKKERHNVQANENPAEPTVLNLVRPLLNRGHTLVMDNFYNSPLLARTLKAQKTDVMGTLRLNREFVPESLRNKNKANMQPGGVAFSQTRDMTITVWMDSNVVSLISTYHKEEVGGKEKYRDFKYKPKVVLDYNLSMGGVDKKDQLLQAVPIERVCNLIWYKKLFRRLLNVSIHNAFVMYSKSGLNKMAQRQFRVLLADEIMQRFRPPQIARPLRAASHFPAKTNVRKSRCKWCVLKKVDTCTAYKCDTCNVNLCIIGCFKDYHVSQGLEQR
ncbi:hypothetical protein PYW07_006302 [Mythimna separata]|uniref:PiggyBac transposable element-derived protein domain-containing protein n=1 Tax=Mythimna separata TaxID=271217 RepID=A0AAD7YTG2_MYTSE|nr:hypothetical protein PYW07_006302 [Mythimna separata]